MNDDIAPRSEAQERFALEPGDRIKRTLLHERFGGSGQGGMTPSATSPNIFLFTDPETGLQHGYVDGWKDDGCFHYTGMGQRGDQLMTHGNAALLNHKRDGREVRLFSGSRDVVTYAGTFETDREAPYYFTDAPETGDGPTRRVIVFRLRPVGETMPPTNVASAPQWTPSVTDVAIEIQHTEKVYVNPRATVTEAERRESALVQSFKAFIEKHNLRISRKRIDPSGEAKPLFTDAFIAELNLLIEAKGTCERGSFRMAIGQLADYRRFLGKPNCAILLPEKPSRDLLDLARAEGITVVWPCASGFESTIALW